VCTIDYARTDSFGTVKPGRREKHLDGPTGFAGPTKAMLRRSTKMLEDDRASTLNSWCRKDAVACMLTNDLGRMPTPTWQDRLWGK